MNNVLFVVKVLRSEDIVQILLPFKFCCKLYGPIFSHCHHVMWRITKWHEEQTQWIWKFYKTESDPARPFTCLFATCYSVLLHKVKLRDANRAVCMESAVPRSFFHKILKRHIFYCYRIPVYFRHSAVCIKSAVQPESWHGPNALTMLRLLDKNCRVILGIFERTEVPNC